MFICLKSVDGFFLYVDSNRNRLRCSTGVNWQAATEFVSINIGWRHILDVWLASSSVSCLHVHSFVRSFACYPRHTKRRVRA